MLWILQLVHLLNKLKASVEAKGEAELKDEAKDEANCDAEDSGLKAKGSRFKPQFPRLKAQGSSLNQKLEDTENIRTLKRMETNWKYGHVL